MLERNSYFVNQIFLWQANRGVNTWQSTKNYFCGLSHHNRCLQFHKGGPGELRPSSSKLQKFSVHFDVSYTLKFPDYILLNSDLICPQTDGQTRWKILDGNDWKYFTVIWYLKQMWARAIKWEAHAPLPTSLHQHQKQLEFLFYEISWAYAAVFRYKYPLVGNHWPK